MSSNAQRPPILIGLVLPLAVGALVRCVGIRGQVLADDELHTVHAALSMPLSQIFRTWTFGGADYSVPLTALHRALMDFGMVFTELGFRWPPLLAGLLAVVLLPRFARHRIGSRAALALAWLIACSPMLVAYSRIIRPYMVTGLCIGVAALLFDRFRQGRSRWDAAGFVLASVLAIYSHLGAAPAIAGMLLFGAAHARQKARDELAIAGLAAITFLLAALLVAPGLDSIIEVVRTTRDGHWPSGSVWSDTGRLFVGTPSVGVSLLAGAIWLRGLVWLIRDQRDFAGLLVSTLAAQAIGLLLLSPDRLEERLVLTRYLVVVLPLALVPLAVGTMHPWWPGAPTWGRRGEACVAAGLLVLLVASGPLRLDPKAMGSFAHAPASLDFVGIGNRIAKSQLPDFYRELARSPEPAPLIEYPWQNLSYHVFDAYQRHHHQPLQIASVLDRSDELRIALRSRVEPQPEAMLRSRARHIVVHLDLRGEALRIESSDPSFEKWLRARRNLWTPLQRAGTGMARRLEGEWGEPDYRDEHIAAWDLERIRATSGGMP